MLISKLYKYQESSDLVPKISSHGFLEEVQDLALDERAFEQRDSCPASIGRVINQFQGIQEANPRPSVNKLKFRRQLLLQMIMILTTFQIHDRWPREVQAEGFFRGAHCLLTENLPYKHQWKSEYKPEVTKQRVVPAKRGRYWAGTEWSRVGKPLLEALFLFCLKKWFYFWRECNIMHHQLAAFLCKRQYGVLQTWAEHPGTTSTLETLKLSPFTLVFHNSLQTVWYLVWTNGFSAKSLQTNSR